MLLIDVILGKQSIGNNTIGIKISKHYGENSLNTNVYYQSICAQIHFVVKTTLKYKMYFEVINEKSKNNNSSVF